MITDRLLSHLVRTILIYGLLLVVSLFWHGHRQTSTVQIAVAKGKRLYDMSYMAGTPLNVESLLDLVLTDRQIGSWLGDSEYDLLDAVPLGYGESRSWRDAGCSQGNCAHILFYNFSARETVNAIFNLDSGQVVDRWRDGIARPAGSPLILEKAVNIAAADPSVRAILGDIGRPDPAMIPMSAWLADDDCRQDWCVDLTYMDPGGSGRVFHIFVNLQQEKVARTFFTRGRPERSLGKPLSQREAYRNGCQEQYGWDVCWEMTAHDGINFRDATYQGRSIFSSVKITQIEAWYPAWPGGYRDEIGFAASVPAFGGTDVIDLGNGFEVRQLFTEFTHWPNCICCYRYEQIIRLFADGSLEMEFVSHGPGCDDVPLYRPFWRIDLDLDGPEGDEVWFWQEDRWVEAVAETELHPFVKDLSPEGYKLATFDGELRYRWTMLPTDPLGRDESRFFILAFGEGEGDGPVVTGPGDTFQPPRQWIDGDSPSGNNIVLWYVPILKQLMGGPWWCMPDPEPEFSPCNVVLRAEPGEELRQPTADELIRMKATPTATATPPAEIEPEQENVGESATLLPTPTARSLEGSDAETIILGAGCGSCHAIGDLGEAHKVGPDLSSIGAEAAGRVPGLSAEAYLRQSILQPNAFLAPDCPNGPCLAGIMPADYGARLTNAQVETLVVFLLSQTAAGPGPEIIGAEAESLRSTPSPKSLPSPKRVNQQPVDNTASAAVQLLLLAIAFLLTLFRLSKHASTEDH